MTRVPRGHALVPRDGKWGAEARVVDGRGQKGGSVPSPRCRNEWGYRVRPTRCLAEKEGKLGGVTPKRADAGMAGLVTGKQEREGVRKWQAVLKEGLESDKAAREALRRAGFLIALGVCPAAADRVSLIAPALGCDSVSCPGSSSALPPVDRRPQLAIGHGALFLGLTQGHAAARLGWWLGLAGKDPERSGKCGVGQDSRHGVGVSRRLCCGRCPLVGLGR